MARLLSCRWGQRPVFAAVADTTILILEEQLRCRLSQLLAVGPSVVQIQEKE